MPENTQQLTHGRKYTIIKHNHHLHGNLTQQLQLQLTCKILQPKTLCKTPLWTQLHYDIANILKINNAIIVSTFYTFYINYIYLLENRNCT